MGCPVCKEKGGGHRGTCPRLLALQALAGSLILANGIFPRTARVNGLETIELPRIAWSMLVAEAERGLGR